MQVASLELSKKLYELSGWENWHYLTPVEEPVSDANHWHKILAYDCGYLLRKLPKTIPPYKNTDYVLHMETDTDGWLFVYNNIQTDGKQLHTFHPVCKRSELEADTPEDCLAKLAIKLIEEGVIDGKR